MGIFVPPRRPLRATGRAVDAVDAAREQQAGARRLEDAMLLVEQSNPARAGGAAAARAGTRAGRAGVRQHARAAASQGGRGGRDDCRECAGGGGELDRVGVAYQ